MPFWVYRNTITPYTEDREGGSKITLVKAGTPVLVGVMYNEEVAREAVDDGNKREAKFNMNYWYQDHPINDIFNVKESRETRYYGPKNSEERRT